MEKYIHSFIEWIYQNYGQTGLAVAFVIYLSILTLAYILLSLLPGSKEVIVWSACSSCKYKRKESNVFVLACAKHEKPRWNQLKSPPCPCASHADCTVIENQSNPALFRRDNLSENIKAG